MQSFLSQLNSSAGYGYLCGNVNLTWFYSCSLSTGSFGLQVPAFIMAAAILAAYAVYEDYYYKKGMAGNYKRNRNLSFILIALIVFGYFYGI